MKKKIDQAKVKRLEQQLRRAADKARYFQQRLWEQEQYFEKIKNEMWETDAGNYFVTVSFQDAIA